MLTSGINGKSWKHPSFRRGQADLLPNIKRVAIKGTGVPTHLWNTTRYYWAATSSNTRMRAPSIRADAQAFAHAHVYVLSRNIMLAHPCL